MSLPYDKALISKAKTLRKQATPQENRLWYCFLRDYPVRFQRQKTIGHYIVDFYCHKARLAVEIDGSQHYEEDGRLYDAERDLYLLNQGIMVLRFSNRDIWERFEGVKIQIDEEVKKRWNPPTTASRSPAPQGADKDRGFGGS